MKKTILLFLSVLTFSSCQKDEELYQNCQCGIIVDDPITTCYTLAIRNECSGRVKSFCFDQNVWFNNYVGDRFCVSNAQPW
jgi:hypothetical protein